MHPFALIPISLIIASGVWFYICGGKAGFRRVTKIMLAIVGALLMLFGQYGVELLWKTFFYNNFMYLLRTYPDAYQILAQFLIAFAIVLASGLLIRKTFTKKTDPNK